MSTETSAATSPNQFARYLLYGGLLALAIGIVTALVAGQQAVREAAGDELLTMLGGDPIGDSAAGPTVIMWIGIVVAVLGAVAVIAYLAVRSIPKTH